MGKGLRRAFQAEAIGHALGDSLRRLEMTIASNRLAHIRLWALWHLLWERMVAKIAIRGRLVPTCAMWCR